MLRNLIGTENKNIQENAVVCALELDKLRALASATSYEAPSVYSFPIGDIRVPAPMVYAGNQ